MKRSVLLGLFVTASMMASTSFAADKPDQPLRSQSADDQQRKIAISDVA